MARAVAPKEIPPLPEGATQWRRSNRQGSMFHAIDALGAAVCGSIRLDRNASRAADNLGDMQFWGCCPRCHSKAMSHKFYDEGIVTVTASPVPRLFPEGDLAVLPRDAIDRLEKRMRSLHENSVFGKLEAVTVNVEQNPDGPSLTLDKLQALMGRMAEIPPPPFFGSSTFFPADKALRFTDKRREYVGAHPDFWQKVPAAAAEQTMRLGEIVVYDLDAHEGRRGEFFEAMARAMGGKGA